jgi:hypothetical protein
MVFYPDAVRSKSAAKIVKPVPPDDNVSVPFASALGIDAGSVVAPEEIGPGRSKMPRTVNGTGHTGPSEFCATSI